MSKAMIEAITMRIDALEKSDKTTSMRLAALEVPKLSQPLPLVSDTKEKKQKKEKKPKPDQDDKPKVKRTTGYILFGKAERDNVVTHLSLSDDKPKNTEIMTEIARLWKALDQTERDEWNLKAKDKANANPTHVPLSDDDDDDDEEN